jgi:acetate---CoA ligase (ADP-forming)
MTERHGAAVALEALTRPGRVVIVGGSADPSKIAGRPVRFLRKGGFRGEAILVNPNLPELEGYRSLASLDELERGELAPDVAFVALGAGQVEGALRSLAEIGVRAAIVLASGFAESGEAGASRERALVEAAGAMRLLGPNSLGLVNLVDGVQLCASDALETEGLEPGRLAVVSQSGGIMASLLSRGAARGIGFSRLYATGNEADLEVADCISWLADDPATSVIACYLETLRDPVAFVHACSSARDAGKQVVCFKVGRSAAGAEAASSHTGALAGSAKVFDALAARAGVTQVARFSELLEVAAACTITARAKGRRVAVLTTTGGAGTLIADACGLGGLSLPSPRPELVADIAALVSGAGIDVSRNPVDLTLAGIRPEIITPVISRLVSDEGFDAFAVVVGASAVANPRLVADPLIACAAAADAKPILAYVSPHLPEVLARLNRAGVPAFDAPESLAAAIVALGGGAARHSSSPGAPGAGGLPGGTAPQAEQVSRALDEVEAKELFARAGIDSPARVVLVEGDDAAALGALRAPYAVKVLHPQVAHKSAIGGVEIGVDAEHLAGAITTVLARARAARADLGFDRVLVEEMVTGRELLIGMRRDPAFGPAIVLGSGGVDAELFEDVVVEIPPLDAARAETMVASLRIAPLLDKSRGSALDTSALVSAICRFSELVMGLGEELVEAEINPLVVGPPGAGVVALDGLVRLRGLGA